MIRAPEIILQKTGDRSLTGVEEIGLIPRSPVHEKSLSNLSLANARDSELSLVIGPTQQNRSRTGASGAEQGSLPISSNLGVRERCRSVSAPQAHVPMTRFADHRVEDG